MAFCYGPAFEETELIKLMHLYPTVDIGFSMEIDIKPEK